MHLDPILPTLVASALVVLVVGLLLRLLKQPHVVIYLLVQDLALVPMLISLQFFSSAGISRGEIALQIAGGICIILFVAWIVTRREIRLPFGGLIWNDHELQIFAAMILCFGLALLTGLMGLSTTLGAFVAGIVVSAARETHWVHVSLDSFRVVFLALFFVSIGMLIDLTFLKQHPFAVALLVGAVLLTNTFINAGILRLLGDNWRESLSAAALLSQIGEFSFSCSAPSASRANSSPSSDTRPPSPPSRSPCW